MEFVRITKSEEIESLVTEFLPYLPHLLKKIEDVSAFAEKLSKFAWVVVVKKQNENASMIVFYSNDLETKCGYFTLLATKPESRRQGLIKSLFQFGFNQMKKDGMEKARLEVDCDNTRARTMYEKMGFVYESDTDRNSIYMKKDLKD